jgi:hypothetical protein
MRILPMLVFFIFFVLPVGLFSLLIIKIVKKTKADAWEGEVTDKLYNERRDDDNPKKMNSFYTIVITTTKGQVRKIAVTAGDFEKWKKGDKAKKEKGKLNPEKIS